MTTSTTPVPDMLKVISRFVSDLFPKMPAPDVRTMLRHTPTQHETLFDPAPVQRSDAYSRVAHTPGNPQVRQEQKWMAAVSGLNRLRRSGVSEPGNRPEFRAALATIKQMYGGRIDDGQAFFALYQLYDRQEGIPASRQELKSFVDRMLALTPRHHSASAGIARPAVSLRFTPPARPAAQLPERVDIGTLPEALQISIATTRSMRSGAAGGRYLDERDIHALSYDEQTMLAMELSRRTAASAAPDTSSDAQLARAIAQMTDAELAQFDRAQSHTSRPELPSRPAGIRQRGTAAQPDSGSTGMSAVWDRVSLSQLDQSIQTHIRTARLARGADQVEVRLTEADFRDMSEQMQSQAIALAFDPRAAATSRSVQRPHAQNTRPQGWKEQAHGFIPDIIKREYVLDNSAFDQATMRQVRQRWEEAATLLYDFTHDRLVPSRIDGANRQANDRARRGNSQTSYSLPPGFDIDRFALNTDPRRAGGDCLFHALEGRTLNGAEILTIRKQVADARLSERYLSRADPNATRANAHFLHLALSQSTSTPPERLDVLRGKDHVPHAVFAAFQACPGIYEGVEGIVQWTLLEQNRGKTVVAMDSGRVEFYKDGDKLEVGEAMTEDLIRRHVDAGSIVLYKADDHWQRVEGNRA